MNDFKKALIEVAGDLSESERNVKRALHGKKHAPKRNYMVVPVFIMALCLIGFTLWLLPNKVEQQQASNVFTNDYLFEYYKATEQMFMNFDSQSEEGKQSIINYAFSNYQTAIAIQEYAKAQGLRYTEQQYEEQEQRMNLLYTETENPFYEQLTKLSGMTLEQYQTYVKPVLLENAIYTTQLNEKWLAENPKLLEDFVGAYTKKIVNDYLEANFETELIATKEYYNVMDNSNYGISVPKSGTIAAIEGNMIYFIQNTTYQEIQQMTAKELQAIQEERLKAWLINYDEVEVQVGDFVRVSVNGTTTSYEEQITNGLAENLEVFLRAKELMLPEIHVTDDKTDEWQELTKEMTWQEQYTVSNYLTPRYIVHINDQTYTIFKNDYNNFFLVPFGEPTIAKLTQGQTKKMEAWLQSFGIK